MFLTIVTFVIVLGVIVFVHELGHFFSAKKFGIGVDEFGFGFPPRIMGIQKRNNKDKKSKWKIIYGSKTPEASEETKGNVIYSINWIPIGGFVKIKGEQGDKKEDHDSFSSKKIWKRATVLSAGVTMNFIFAFILIAIGFTIGTPNVLSDDLPSNATVTETKVQVIQVQEGSPAEKQGIEVGDIFISVNGNELLKTEDFTNVSKPNLNQEIEVVISSAGEQSTISLIPEDLNNDGTGAVGVWLVDTGLVKYPWYYSIWMGLKTTVSITWQILLALFEIIKNLIFTQSAGVDIAGPVGIAVLTGQVAKLGFIYILNFAAIISINLGIINFIPFPALDGGRVLFLVIEKLRGKPMKENIEAALNNIGFLILIGLVLVVTFIDVSRFSDSIKGFFINIF
ncbi:MAG: RIP metalloprotease RseP [bacterium]|nr:RIP metalloprotease RseP [bacterium]